MALFACNYDNMLFGSNYYRVCLQTIEPDEVLYIVDTEDWIVEKNNCKRVKRFSG